MKLFIKNKPILFFVAISFLIMSCSKKTEHKDFTDLKTEETIYPDWFKITLWDLNDDIKEAVNNKKTGIMILTSTKSCSYCIAFIEKSLGDPNLSNRLRKNFDVLGLEVIADTEITDVDGKTYHVKDFLTKYKAYFTPTLIFFGSNGRLLLNIAGYYPPEKFSEVLDFLEGKHYESETWLEYSKRNEKIDPDIKIQQDGEIFKINSANLKRNNPKTNKPLLVLFEKNGCKSCKTLHDEILSVATTRSLIQKFDAAQLNAGLNETIILPDGSKKSPSAWADELNISYFPAFVFFDETGKEVFRIDTFTRNTRLEWTMELVLAKGYIDEPQLQRWRRLQFVKNNQK